MTPENTNKITLETSDGVATIDAKLFQGYNQEALDLLSEADGIMQNFKDVVETVAETTGLKKATVSKFFKQRYADKIREGAATAELFEQLEDILA